MVTIVDSLPPTAVFDATLAVEAILFVLLDDGVTVGRTPAFNGSSVVICGALLFSMDDRGHLRACAFNRYIDNELQIFKRNIWFY